MRTPNNQNTSFLPYVFSFVLDASLVIWNEITLAPYVVSDFCRQTNPEYRTIFFQERNRFANKYHDERTDLCLKNPFVEDETRMYRILDLPFILLPVFVLSAVLLTKYLLAVKPFSFSPSEHVKSSLINIFATGIQLISCYSLLLLTNNMSFSADNEKAMHHHAITSICDSISKGINLSKIPTPNLPCEVFNFPVSSCIQGTLLILVLYFVMSWVNKKAYSQVGNRSVDSQQDSQPLLATVTHTSATCCTHSEPLGSVDNSFRR